MVHYHHLGVPVLRYFADLKYLIRSSLFWLLTKFIITTKASKALIINKGTSQYIMWVAFPVL